MLSTSLPTPPFTVAYASEVTYAVHTVKKCPSIYLRSDAWVETPKAPARGVRVGKVNEDVVTNANTFKIWA